MIAVTVLAVAGCAGAGNAAVGTAPPSSAVVTTDVAVPTPSLDPDPEAFLAWAKDAWWGGSLLVLRGEDNILGMGNARCDMLASSSFDSTVQYMTSSSTKPSVTEAGEMLEQAVTNLCPQNRSLVP